MMSLWEVAGLAVSFALFCFGMLDIVGVGTADAACIVGAGLVCVIVAVSYSDFRYSRKRASTSRRGR